MMPSDPAIASSGDLRTLLYERSQRFRNVIPVCRAPESGEKWLLSSTLQKCIRRGRPELAAIAAETLHCIDPRYLWKRLPTIAMEDVAYGDKVLCALTIEASRSSVFRRRIGERQVLHYLIHALCSAPKCRALTDLLMISDGPTPRARAWYTHVDKLGLSYVDHYLATHGLTSASLGAMVPRLLQIMPAEVSIVVNPPDAPGDVLIHDLPAAVFDKHVAVGKRGFAYFAKACRPVREFFAQNPELDPVKSLGIVVFLIESAHLDRELDWPGRSHLYEQSVHRDFRAYGMTAAQGNDLQLIARANRESLNAARRRIVGG